MTRGEARRTAEAAREQSDVPPEGRLYTVDKRHIELAGSDTALPSPV